MPDRDGLPTDKEVFADVGRALGLRPGAKAQPAGHPRYSAGFYRVDLKGALSGQAPLSMRERAALLVWALDKREGLGALGVNLQQLLALLAGASIEEAEKGLREANREELIGEERVRVVEMFDCIVCGKQLPDDDVESVTCSEACAEKAVAQELVSVEGLGSDEPSPRKCPSHPNDEGGACEPMPSEPWRCVYGNHPPDPAKACCGEFGTGSSEHEDDCFYSAAAEEACGG